MKLEHHASYVILALSRKCAEALHKGNELEAARLSLLTQDIEHEFPEAASEVDALYGK